MSDWAETTLANVAEIGAGNSAPQDKRLFECGTYPFIRTSDVGKIRFGSISDAADRLNEAGVQGLRLAPKGTILMPKSGASTFLNHRVEMSVDGYVSSHLATVLARPELCDGRFLLYYLSTVRAQDLIQDHKYPSLTLGTIGDIPVSLPPLDEQKRIVAVLDQAFVALDRARANAGANLRDASELFGVACARIIDLESKGETRRLRLDTLTTRLTNGYVGPTRDIYVEDGVPYLLARHVRNAVLSFDGRTYVSPEFNEKNKKSRLLEDDVLLVQSGHIGHCAIVPKEHEGHNCHAMIVMTPRRDVVSGNYLSAALNTPRLQAEFKRIRTGSTVPHLTCKMVREIEVEVPPRASQDRIVSGLKLLSADIDTVRSRYVGDMEDLAKFRQSLLQAAFSGQLH